MKSIIVAMASASLCLTACATTGMRPTPAQADAAIAAAQARYDQVREWAALFLPYMPAIWQERVRLAGRTVELALGAARTATTIAERKAALAQAQAATDALAHVTGS